MPDATVCVKAFLVELVDAVRYSQSWSESMEKEVEARRELDRQLDAIEELKSRISALLENRKLDPEIAEPLAKVVNDFVSAATQQSTLKLTEKMKALIEQQGTETNSLRLKTVKSLESFLAVTPLLVLDEEIGLDLSEGSYAAFAHYKCAAEVEYEFLLSTANSVLFKSELALSAKWKGAKLPVRLSKAWLKKEPVPDYERLDNYVLLSARASRNHLSVVFSNRETSASASVIYSRSNSDSFISVEYLDKAGKVDVTGEPSLNRHLDLNALKKIMSSLLDDIAGLDHDKLKLARLSSAGEDVLQSLNCFDFMRSVAGILVQSKDVRDAFRQLDARFAVDRLQVLGERGNAIYSALGLGAQSPKPVS